MFDLQVVTINREEALTVGNVHHLNTLPDFCKRRLLASNDGAEPECCPTSGLTPSATVLDNSSSPTADWTAGFPELFSGDASPPFGFLP